MIEIERMRSWRLGIEFLSTWASDIRINDATSINPDADACQESIFNYRLQATLASQYQKKKIHKARDSSKRNLVHLRGLNDNG